MEEQIEKLLQYPYWVIDVLPKQVPENSPGQYFAVDEYYRKEALGAVKKKHVDLMLKLNCFKDIILAEEAKKNPAPSKLKEEMLKKHLCVMVDDAMIVSEPDDTYLTVYNPDKALLDLLQSLSAGEGLYVWRPLGSQKILETDRMILRPWEVTDAEECFRYATDPRVGPAAGWAVHTSIENTRQIIRDVLAVPETYAIVLKETGLPIGSIGLHHNDLASKDDEVELGYWLGVPYWGQGLVPEASREVLRHAFEDLHMARVWCAYYEGNDKSKRVQEKLGFQYQWTTEGIEVAALNETRTGHVNLMTIEDWKRLYKNR